ncbi:YgaP family membrane protein [Catalinimonas alkaloidigena]|uniref:YgaP family membrane protein n=1 Tax=Catalinimonas alkaloidigena TaxID=1075417 RepID=UPI003B8A8752
MIFGLIMSGTLSGAWAIILGAIGGIFVITSIMGFCPLYILTGTNTCPAKK